MADESDDDSYSGRPGNESTDQKVVQEAAKQAVRKYNLKSNEEYYRIIVEIQGSKFSFCVGYTHWIKLLLGKSQIKKEEMSPENFYKSGQSEEMAGSESERITIVARCEDCDQYGEDALPNPCRFITLCTDVWGNFDGL